MLSGYSTRTELTVPPLKRKDKKQKLKEYGTKLARGPAVARPVGSLREGSVANLTQGLARKSSSLLSDLDQLKDALHYRGGSTGETPYFVLSDALLEIVKFMQHNNISLLRSVRLGDCDRYEKRALYSEFCVPYTIHYKKKNPYYLGKDAIFYKLESKSGISTIYFMIGYLEVLFDSYLDFGDKPFYYDLLESFVWLSNLSPEVFIPFVKYITAYPMARYMKQDDLPKMPAGFPKERKLLFVGKLKKIIKNRIVSFNKKNSSFFLGLLQGVKRAANKVSDSFILKSLETHALVLSQPARSYIVESEFEHPTYKGLEFTGDWFEDDEKREIYNKEYTSLNDSLQMFKKDFIRMSQSIASGFVLSPEFIFTNKWVPSPNSANISSRTMGGQFGHIYRKYIQNPFVEFVDNSIIPEPLLIGSDNMDISDFDQERELIKKTELYVRNELMSMHLNDGIYHEFRGEDLPRDSVMFKVVESLDEQFSPNILPVDNVVALAEPLKVRTITVGDPDIYFASKPLQVKLWKHISYYDQFKLISEPISEDHLHCLIRQEILLMRKLKFNLNFDSFVSGDYKSATDGLDIQFSKLALEPFISSSLKEFPLLESYFKVVRPALSEHRLEYRILKGSDSEEFRDFLVLHNIDFDFFDEHPRIDFFTIKQRNGQLMGSPLSFPILCIVNLIAYWRSMEIYTAKRIKFKDLPVKVNGDDILFRSNQIHYGIWKKQIEFVSFTLSLGKNYIHSRLLTVNSVMYEFALSTEIDYLYNLSLSEQEITRDFIGEWRFDLIGFMNPGLLTAQSKGTMRDKTRSLPLSDLYSIVIKGASSKLRAHYRFLHYNIDAIKRMTDNGKFNLFIPVHLGGLGFEIFSEVQDSIKFTKFQLQFAGFLNHRIKQDLREGVFPKKYFSALVDDGLSNSTPFFEKYKGRYTLYLETEITGKEDEFILFPGYERISAHPLSQGVNIGEPEIKYRLPSKSLLREFNRAVRDEVYLPYFNFKIEDIIATPRKPSLFSRKPDYLFTSDELLERYLLSNNTSWKGISDDFDDSDKVITVPYPLVDETVSNLGTINEESEYPSDYQLEVWEVLYPERFL